MELMELTKPTGLVAFMDLAGLTKFTGFMELAELKDSRGSERGAVEGELPEGAPSKGLRGPVRRTAGEKNEGLRAALSAAWSPPIMAALEVWMCWRSRRRACRVRARTGSGRTARRWCRGA
ncbi:hypothetical protein GCM10022252_44820 [Streptosporangium oxazolinicum]|uniref:STAS domain-containing protein n=1 Tax=Streptosporangium oxazolinicum TaxID=909287 RepID=A0ABP8B452_9ACTN